MGGVWLREAADVLRAAGIPVVEEKYTHGQYAGKTWSTVGRDRGYGCEAFTAFRFIMWHHDASSPGPSASVGEYCKYMSLGPACNAWVCLGCNGKHPSGTWHLLAAGRVNHAGEGGPGWGVQRDAMNYQAFGIEVDHTTGESWKPDSKQAQLAMLRKGTAALFKHYRLDPVPGLLFHKTWTDGGIDGVPVLPTRGRKIDIAGLELLHERAAVKGLMGSTPPVPAPKPQPARPVVRLSQVAPGKSNPETLIVKRALIKEGLLRGAFTLTPRYGRGMQRAYRAWQEKLGYTGKAADGVAGLDSLRRLGLKHGFEVRAS